MFWFKVGVATEHRSCNAIKGSGYRLLNKQNLICSNFFVIVRVVCMHYEVSKDGFTLCSYKRFHAKQLEYKGSGTGPAGPVLAGPLFQRDSKYFPVDKKSNAWLRIGLKYEQNLNSDLRNFEDRVNSYHHPWNTLLRTI